MNRQAFVKEKRTLQIRLDTPSAHVMLMLRCAVSQCPIRPKGPRENDSRKGLFFSKIFSILVMSMNDKFPGHSKD